jgi:hypothetical protein
MFSGTIKCNDSSYTNHIPIIKCNNFLVVPGLGLSATALGFLPENGTAHPAGPDPRDPKETRGRAPHGWTVKAGGESPWP